MRCIALIEAQRPGLDSVLIWERNNQLVAFAYEDGRVMMSRPLASPDLDAAVNETLESFQITDAQMSKLTDWTNSSIQAQPVGPPEDTLVISAAIKRRQHKELYPVRFEPVNWEPQVEITFNRDVTGWLDHDQGVRFHFSAGKSYHVDEQHAVEFIVKGYAEGKLPRDVSEDERAELRSNMTTIGLDRAPQAR